MEAKILDGKKLAEELRVETEAEVAALKKDKGITPGLAVVLVGEDPASQMYVRMKAKSCVEIGIHSEEHRLPPTASEKEILSIIDKLNKDPKIHGMLVQLPLPDRQMEERVMEAVLPEKDVDGFHPHNLGRLLMGDALFAPCTPLGVQVLLLRNHINPAGKHAVIIGRSVEVGKPMAAILMQKAQGADATVTVCHSRTKNMAEMTRQADILIAAIGRAEMVKADMVKEGAVVVDVGTNRVEDPTAKKGFRLVGDVAFKEVSQKASWITPVPGGVGPMTIAMLLSNTVKAAKRTGK